jgi:hypothetical protein
MATPAFKPSARITITRIFHPDSRNIATCKFTYCIFIHHPKRDDTNRPGVCDLFDFSIPEKLVPKHLFKRGPGGTYVEIATTQQLMMLRFRFYEKESRFEIINAYSPSGKEMPKTLAYAVTRKLARHMREEGIFSLSGFGEVKRLLDQNMNTRHVVSQLGLVEAVLAKRIPITDTLQGSSVP